MNSNFYDSDSGFEDDIESPPPYDEERIPKLICFCGELTLFRFGLYSCLLNECAFSAYISDKADCPNCPDSTNIIQENILTSFRYIYCKKCDNLYVL